MEEKKALRIEKVDSRIRRMVSSGKKRAKTQGGKVFCTRKRKV